MSNEFSNSYDKAVEEVAEHLDRHEMLERTTSDPVLGLLQFELLANPDNKEALESTVDQISETAKIVMSVLDFPPRATTINIVFQRSIEAGAPPQSIDAAVDYLLRSGQIEKINGWYFKVPARDN